MKKNIKEILMVVLLVIVLIIVIFLIRHKIYNNIEENWIFKISPNYLNSPPNTIYFYKDSYIITNSFVENKWQNIVHKRGKLSSEITEDLIATIKEEAEKEKKSDDIYLEYIIMLKNGEQLTLTADMEAMNILTKLMNYDGKIWYTTIND